MHWAKVLTLDSLIANTDRHQDNWGVVYEKINGKAQNLRYSPAFDNGTAMEYNIPEAQFHLFGQKQKLDAQLCSPRRAKHHMKWALDDDAFLNYYEFMARFVLKYPETKGTVFQCLRFTRKQAEEILLPLCDVVEDPKYALSRNRLMFMLDMVFHRKELLERALA